MQLDLKKQLYDDITTKLLEQDFLTQYHLTEELISSEIENPHFMQQLNTIIEDGDYSCQRVYDLCKHIFSSLWKGTPPELPLHYIYQFTLSKSFPHSVEITLDPQNDNACLLYLAVLRIVSDYQRRTEDGTWQSKYPLDFLTSEEVKQLPTPRGEYKSFVKAFKEEFIYEMMKLNFEVMGHNTLDHICAVHYLSLHVGRQLLDRGVSVDLGRVSGAAAGHDIGKFGCRSFESKRVAYLHYYYTDQWFNEHNFTFIGHIALNHSVWDLELENLSIESLILIYSDFRVKNVLDDSGKYVMKMISLEEAFQTILEKLDNVDDEKEKRYRRVYQKLRDFESYLLDFRVLVDPDGHPSELLDEKERRYYSLMHGNLITENIKYLAIHHNIHLMYKLRDETSLNELIEVIRGEKDPKTLREYLDLFDEYSTYLTQKQKVIMLKFLYEKLIHPEEDIRSQCAELIGSLIATFDENYRKEIPEGVTLDPPTITSCGLLTEYLERFLWPDHKIISLHHRWIRYSVRPFIASLFKLCPEYQLKNYKNIILPYYNHNTADHAAITMDLFETLNFIPISSSDLYFDQLGTYILEGIKSERIDLQVAALETMVYFIDFVPAGHNIYAELKAILHQQELTQSIPAIHYLHYQLALLIFIDKADIIRFQQHYEIGRNKVPDIYLSNLKTATNWITKKTHVELLLRYSIESSSVSKFYTAMHFCNLLKVSAVESVRNRAGESLVNIFSHLPIEQRNDIAIDLLRALEIEGVQFTKFIPNYLGQIIGYLKPIELDEIIEDFYEKIKQSNSQTSSLLLKTIGIFLSHYAKYQNLFDEDTGKYELRRQKLLSILLNGLVHDDVQINQIAFSVIGKDLFRSHRITLEEKHEIFQQIAKKLLILLSDTEEKELTFLTNSAGLNHIYRFISDYHFFVDVIEIKVPDKIAFFPGSFDPFTLSHKEITRAIRDTGFEVYLTVDEFSWSKRTQPNLIRKNIINMSVADELDVYLYPEDFPVNIASPEDLKKLVHNFPQSQVYIVVGSDVILNASAYDSPTTEFCISQLPHVIFERRVGNFAIEQDTLLHDMITQMKGPVLRLNLPPQYEDISSSQIRDYIDDNRDISNLIDPLAQRYIYEHSLYRREPQYKSFTQPVSMDFDFINGPDDDLIKELVSIFHKNESKSYKSIQQALTMPQCTLLLARNANDPEHILGYSLFHWLPSDMFYQTFTDRYLSEQVRNQYVGRIVCISGLFVQDHATFDDLHQVVLSETLAYALKHDYSFGVFFNTIEPEVSPNMISLLNLHGFEDISYEKSCPLFIVNMTNPCTLTLDINTIIKEPFNSNYLIKKTVLKTRKKLQEAFTKLYPGHLVLSFDRKIIDEVIMKKICMENSVPPIAMVPRQLGEFMCVPFGNILNRAIVPNTVTKSLHIERLFAPDMQSFTIGAYPFYLDIKNQVRMIGSFDRPVILVDDLLNKGYRLKGLDPLLKSENINVKKVIVGLLSGRGKELMEIQNRQVDSAYFLPKLRLWFNEALLYPFIGGDTLWRGVYPEKNILSSVNFILPYTSPSFIKDVPKETLYDLSETCLQNAIDILKAVEIEYQRINEKKLTLSMLGEVFLYPRYPDQGENVSYNYNVHPSQHLERDLEQLKRLKYSFTI
ncbi:cytidylyltransferase [Alkaliphilus metalliredigens QYMF]|uniref:nicotinate-nucleotide adenylyltransferase n=1 Tax=Alkaliphilus metalliredigens (strain QYMF) TaxID=293826 RepID=A6TNT0_ALKMQ|nr:cytidyltransferase [Alkaliphilus metalliredigens]ABR47848.1 cytidylyltransferase [Alkaliphilus metalliredigens QYMF]